MSDELVGSRPRLLASRVSSNGVGLGLRLSQFTTVVSIDERTPGALGTALILVDTLARILGHTVVVGPISDSAREQLELAGGDLPGTVRIVEVQTARGDLRVHIGSGHRPHCEIRAIPDGYGAQLAGDPTVELVQNRPPNSLGHMTTSALLAAEVFKIAADVVDSRQVRHAHVCFCPVALGDDLNVAPELQRSELTLCLAGNGAIGTAVARILSGLPIAGILVTVDTQEFALENVGTYSLGRLSDVAAGTHKTELVQRALSATMHVMARPWDVAELAARIDAAEIPWPQFVLTALDDDEARRAAQRIESDRLIDAATGETFVGIQDTVAGGPCIRCFRPARTTSGFNDLVELARVTGLDTAYLRVDGVLDADDLERLDPEQQERLKPHVGKPRCALASALGLTGRDTDAGYQASIPFVSQLAACLQVGRLVAHLVGQPSDCNEVQFDVLLGPQLISSDSRDPVLSCQCQARRGTVESVRGERRALSQRTSGIPGESA